MIDFFLSVTLLTYAHTHNSTIAGRNRAKKIYEEEMKRGVTKRKITKVVMVGVAGSGKTTSLETLIDEKPQPEEDRESTPLLKRPVQTEVIYIDEKVRWRKKSPEEKKQYIASLLRARAQRLGQPSPTGNHVASASTPTPATPTSVQSPPVQPASSTNQSSIATRPTKTSAYHNSAVTTASEERPSSAAPAEILESLLQTSEVDQSAHSAAESTRTSGFPTAFQVAQLSPPAHSASETTMTPGFPNSVQLTPTLAIPTLAQPTLIPTCTCTTSTTIQSMPTPADVTSAQSIPAPTISTPIQSTPMPAASTSVCFEPTPLTSTTIQSISAAATLVQSVLTPSCTTSTIVHSTPSPIPLHSMQTPTTSTTLQSTEIPDTAQSTLSPTTFTSVQFQPASSANQSSIPIRPTKTSATPTSATTTASEERPSSAAPAVTLDSLLQSSEVDQEYISLINIPSDSSENILTETVVYIVDSGGQPEFVEAMTVFLGETSACILVIDLSQSLDECPIIGYYRRGKPLSKPYRCTRTNEEILQQCMTNMSTFSSKTKGPPTKLLFLGTHRDVLCATETLVQKNLRLKTILPAKFDNQIIRLDTKTLIFEINALHPDDTDKKMAEKVRSYILEQCPAKEVEIPVRWHALEEKLKSLCMGLGRKVMSYDESWQVAQSLGLDESSFDAALDFFHSMSLMFYFRDILPAVVFIDPQVMLDKVSELIEFIFELRDECTSEPTAGHFSKQTSHSAIMTGDCEPHHMKAQSTSQAADIDLLPPGWYKFNKFGHITKPFLNDKRFSGHYHAGIFTSDDLIHLLEELLVFAKRSTDEGPDTWFMPSVLRQVPAEKMKEVCVSASALVVDFPDGGPQNGIFCSLMSHVLSPQNHHPHPWKLCLSSNEPTCLYRNCIQFYVPEYGSVTLIDRYQYFEVHISNCSSEEEMQELWQHIRIAVFSGIESVCGVLGYSDNKPRPAIICPIPHTDKPHAAYIKNGKWNCTSDMRVCGKLGDLGTKFHWCEKTG